MTNVLFDFSPGLSICLMFLCHKSKTKRQEQQQQQKTVVYSHTATSSSSCIDGYRQTKFVGGKPYNGLAAQSLHACEGGKRQPDGSIGLNVNILTE